MMLQAVVMAGGRGERLQPLTARRPKPLVPFFGLPLLGYLLGHLARLGVGEAFVTAGYLGHQIAGFVQSGDFGLPVHCTLEERPRGTAGAVLDLLPQLESRFLVVSGDALMDLDLPALSACHEADGNVATICLAPPGERLRFGSVTCRDRRVTGFREKPEIAELLPGSGVNAGCYLLERDALAGLDPERPLDFAKDVLPALLNRGAPLGAVPSMRYWRDLGTLDAYRDAHFDGLGQKLPVGWMPRGLRIDADAPGGPVALGPGVEIARDAHIEGPALLGPGCRLAPGARVTRSLLLGECRIGAGSWVTDCVLDGGTVVPPHRRVVGAGLAGGRQPLRLRRQPARTPQAAPAPLPDLAVAAPHP